MDLRRLNRIAARQWGLFTQRQARDCGLSAFQIRSRIRAAEWRRVTPRVLASSALPLTPALNDRAAQLTVPGSVLAGPSAARCWDLPVRDGRIFLVVAPRANPVYRGATYLYESLDPTDVRTCDGAAVTSRAKTIVDCLRFLPEARALDLLDRALQENWINLGELADRLHHLAGRRGAPRLVRLMRKVVAGARSAAERLIAHHLDAAGVAGWTLNAPIADDRGFIGLGDVVFREARVVVEVDGFAYHGPERFQHDRDRQNRLVAAGWTVVRFSWRDLVERPGYVVGTVAGILANREIAAVRDHGALG